jgi:hypothetical protein
MSYHSINTVSGSELEPEHQVGHPAADAWPSDDQRFKALAVSASPLLFEPETADSGQKPKQTLLIDTTIRNPLRMAQHQPSTFRILVAIMRKHHMSVFNGDPNTTNDHAFWTNLFMEGLDRSWMVGTTTTWKERFSWVLQYIRTGSLPQEAQVAKEVLRLARRMCYRSRSIRIFTMRKSQLNPDLSPVWVKEFLTASGDIIEVERGARTRLEGFDIDKLCKHFGILIAPLWEEEVYPQAASHRVQNTTSNTGPGCPAPSSMVQRKRRQYQPRHGFAY